MGVNQHVAALTVPGQMNLPYAGYRHRIDIGPGVEAVIGGTDVDIVDIEQQVAPGPGAHRVDKLPFGHDRRVKADIARRIFDQHRPAEQALGQINILADQIKRFLGIGQRQQVMRIERCGARPAQMVGDEQRFDLVDQSAQPGEVGPVKPVRRPDRQRNPVQGDRVAIPDLAKDMPGTPAIDHEIFRNDFDKIHRDATAQKVRIMLLAQAKPIGVRQLVGHHVHSADWPGHPSGRPGRWITSSRSGCHRLQCRPLRSSP